MDDTRNNHPVLIAGAGPVGLGLAIELGRLGIPCTLVEKRDGALTVPKMSAVSARNMEFCRRWGIAEQVQQAVWSKDHPHDFVYAESLQGAELARMKMPSYAKRGDMAFTPEGACHCPQIFFDPILAARAKSLSPVTLRYRTALTGLDPAENAVHATLIDQRSGARETVTASYVVGCDGAGGYVRDALGIALDGQGTLATSINIFFRSADLMTRHDKGWARFYRLFDADCCWAELIAIDGGALWRLTVFNDPVSDIDADAYLRKMMGGAFAYEIIDVSPWERRDFVATHYRGGRVFIAGDAAHQCSPTGGLGMHTGLGEAVNLAWKLAAMTQGWGGAHLLDSYDAECRPIAARNVALGTRAFNNIISLPGREAAADALAGGASALTRLSVNEMDKTQYCYEGSPICVADGTPPPPNKWGPFVPSARPGTRAPHGWIADGVSTLDLFGDGFTLLRLGPPAVAGASALTDHGIGALADAAASRAVPLEIVDIADTDIAGMYGAALVLVRPDGHVAWRGAQIPDDAKGLIDRVRGALPAPDAGAVRSSHGDR